MNDKTNILEMIVEKWPFFSKGNAIPFQTNGELTLGVEIELQLVDKNNKNLIPKAEELLKEGAGLKKLKPEFYLSTVEINTDKCQTVQDVEQDLTQSFDALQPLGEPLHMDFATTGCHPFSRYNDCVVTPSKRYNELIDRNQWVTRRMTVYGLHVHIGMKSGDDCIRFNNFFLHFLPHLLALSASSPFWQGEDTGLASCRPTTYEALPTAGQPYRVHNWKEFENLYETLKKCDAIQSLKDLWWDMRPSPILGTLEIRVCDGPATLAEALAITAYIHLLATWFNDHGSWIEQVPPPPRWVSRENKWRVMRYGLDAQLITNLDGSTKHIRQEIEEWLVKLEPYIQQRGYAAYIDTLRNILVKGNSTARQRKVFAETQSLESVVAFNVSEFNQRTPLWEEEQAMRLKAK